MAKTKQQKQELARLSATLKIEREPSKSEQRRIEHQGLKKVVKA